MVVFVSSPVSHCGILILIKLGSALNVRRLQIGTSFLVLLVVEVDWCLMHFLYTVVFDPVIDYNSNRSDSDVSLADILWFNSQEHDVRYSSILHALCFLSHPSGPYSSSNPPRNNHIVSSTAKNSSIVHIPSNRLEVTVHKAYEEYPMSPMNSYPSSDARLADKPARELGSDDNVEGRG